MKKIVLVLALAVGAVSLQAVPLFHKHHKTAKKAPNKAPAKK